MKAEIRSVMSSDVDVNGHVPIDLHNDAVVVSLSVGPEGQAGEEHFEAVICTPGWVQRKIREKGPQAGRHLVIVDPMDLSAAITWLCREVEQLEAADWVELAEKIGRLARWEFEDYVP